MGIELNFKVDDARLVAAIRAKAPTLVSALISKMTYLLLRLQQKVQHNLEGEVLNHRTGKLVNSVFIEYPTLEGAKLIGRVAAAGGPAWYGKVHELGGKSAYEIRPVTKEALRFMMGGKEVFAKSVMHPPMPARPWARPAAESMKDEFTEGYRQTVNEVLK
jgi:hypothetical protein